MSVGEICNREVIVVGRELSVAEAAVLMRRHHVGDLIAVEERGGGRVPVGILTDRDIVMEVVAAGVDSVAITVGDVMSGDLLTIRESESLLDTVTRMRSKGVRRVPVVDDSGMLAGILSVDDIIDVLAEELTSMVKLMTREQARERESRSRT